ncbi:MAG TPA: hypothetical protein VLX29_02330 [Nitrospirota bacterium]|nr:hypothetical protein [Nitrospirota bacterium]
MKKGIGEPQFVQLLVWLALICLCGIVPCASCAASGQQVHVTEQDMQSQQIAHGGMMTAHIIIKFRNPNIDPSLPEFVVVLSKDAHATLTYLRPVSIGAYVFSVLNISNDKELQDVIRRLSKRQDIQYVEQDRIMHIQ